MNLICRCLALLTVLLDKQIDRMDFAAAGTTLAELADSIEP